MRRLAVLLLGGCAMTVTPPASPVDPVEVVVIDYGRHSALALPATQGRIEFAYGEWAWFAGGEDAWYRAFPAVLWSTQGTLARRVLAGLPPREGEVRLVVDRDRADALRSRLDADFERNLDRTGRHRTRSGLEFVPVPQGFHAFHNCNHAVAGWLRELGCAVEGTEMFAEFEVTLGSER